MQNTITMTAPVTNANTTARATTTSAMTTSSMSMVPLALHLRPPTVKINYQAALQSLSTILHTHRGYSDFLSRKIFLWSHSVIQDAGQLSPNDEAGIEQLAHERIDELIREILINPLDDRNLLEDPILLRDWVWERWVYEDCRTLFVTSPLDGGAMTLRNEGGGVIQPSPHLLVKAMLVWLHTILQPVPQASARSTATTTSSVSAWSSSAVVSSSSSPSHDLVGLPVSEGLNQRHMQVLSRNHNLNQLRRLVYEKACRAVIFQRRNQETRQNMNSILVRVDQEVANMRQQSAQVIHEAQQEARRAEERIRRQIAETNQTHQASLTGLRNQIAQQEHSHQVRVQTLNAQIAAQDRNQTQAITSLNNTISAARRENEAAINALSRQMEVLNLRHTDAVADLNRQLNQTTAQHAAAIETVKKTAATASALERQIQEGQVRLQQAAADLAAAQAQNAQHTAHIANLNGQIAMQTQRVAELAEQANSSCRRRCVVS